MYHGWNVVPITLNKTPAMPQGYLDSMSPAEISEKAIEKIASGEAGGFGILSGVRGARRRGDSIAVLAHIELEGRALQSEAFMTEWADSIERHGATALMERLNSGWVEDSPGKGRHFFFEVEVADEAHWAWQVDSLPCKAAKRIDNDASTVWAEFCLTHSYLIVAPTGGRVHKTGRPWVRIEGGPESIPVLTGADLHMLSDVLADLGDAETSASAAPSMDARTADVRTSYNRGASDDSTLEILKSAGWVIARTEASGEVRLAFQGDRAQPGSTALSLGGPNRPAGSVFQYSTAHVSLPEGYHSAFDVRALLTEDGDRVSLAEKLVTDGVVKVSAKPLMPRQRTVVYPKATPTDRLVEQIARALSEAKHPVLSDDPFVVMQETANGVPLAPVTMSRVGDAKTWSPAEWQTLALAAVQPKEQLKSSEKFLHGLEAPVVAMVGEAARTALLPARYVSDSPVITDRGQVVTEPGYHPRERALVAIPRAQREAWKAYRVPSSPSARDAQTALDFLRKEVLSDFPFASFADEARALTMFLTMAGRQLIPNCMAFLVDAPDRGTGKSLLVMLSRIIASGAPGATTIKHNKRADEETAKAIVSGYLAGSLYLHVDEVPRGDSIDSGVLSEFITAHDGAYSARVLGASVSVTPAGMVCTFCGNNVQPGGDFNRRILAIRLQHRLKGAAHARDGFRHADITTWVMANRPRLLAAVHTILLHGLQNPVSLDSSYRMGSFERMRDVIVGSLTHVTMEGKSAAEWVKEGLAEWQESQDDAADELGELYTWWAERAAGQWVKPSALVQMWDQASPGPNLPRELAPGLGQSAASRARSWALELRKQRDRSVFLDGVQYRLAIKESPKGAQFLLEVVGDVAVTAEPAVEAPVQASAPNRAPARPAPLRLVPPTEPSYPAPVDEDEPVGMDTDWETVNF